MAETIRIDFIIPRKNVIYMEVYDEKTMQVLYHALDNGGNSVCVGFCFS